MQRTCPSLLRQQTAGSERRSGLVAALSQAGPSPVTPAPLTHPLRCPRSLTFSPAGANGKGGVVSVNYDDFIDDVSPGDELLVDGGIMSFVVRGKTDTDVEVGDRRLRLQGCSAALACCSNIRVLQPRPPASPAGMHCACQCIELTHHTLQRMRQRMRQRTHSPSGGDGRRRRAGVAPAPQRARQVGDAAGHHRQGLAGPQVWRGRGRRLLRALVRQGARRARVVCVSALSRHDQLRALVCVLATCMRAFSRMLLSVAALWPC